MKWTATILTALTLALAAPAFGDNYGHVSPATRARVTALIHQAFDRYGVGNTMVCIARRESGLNARAANWTDANGGSFGLFQINGVWRHHGESIGFRHHPGRFPWRMWNPATNIATAVSLYHGSGLGPWGGGC